MADVLRNEPTVSTLQATPWSVPELFKEVSVMPDPTPYRRMPLSGNSIPLESCTIIVMVSIARTAETFLTRRLTKTPGTQSGFIVRLHVRYWILTLNRSTLAFPEMVTLHVKPVAVVFKVLVFVETVAFTALLFESVVFAFEVTLLLKSAVLASEPLQARKKTYAVGGYQLNCGSFSSSTEPTSIPMVGVSVSENPVDVLGLTPEKRKYGLLAKGPTSISRVNGVKGTAPALAFVAIKDGAGFCGHEWTKTNPALAGIRTEKV